MSEIRGFSTRRTTTGVQIARVHYSADPDRDSEWAKRERRKYSSQAAWDREQEIVHEAGGGELVFAEILNRHADKIIIQDPSFQASPHWARIGGFDHGKTNPTAALVTAVDHDGTIYCLAEYYQPGLTPHQHMDNLHRLPDFLTAHCIYADPSIFYRNQAQADGRFISVAEIYLEAGVSNFTDGQNAELAGIERILEAWRDLDNREPTLKIVCPYDYSRKRFGLFENGCPNLLWELMRTRRQQLSASQLMRRNPTEAIVDKDNHLRDALKYILLSHPLPSPVPRQLERERIIREAFENGTYPSLGPRMALFDAAQKVNFEPMSYKGQWPPAGYEK
jgi:hypothetical protein